MKKRRRRGDGIDRTGERREHIRATPDDVPGDAAIERRRGADPNYRGPERRIARQ